MKVTISIDGKTYEVEKAKPLLSVLKSLGIKVPSLCHHPALRPSGVCKLCAVEVSEKSKAPAIRLACTTQTRSGLEVVSQNQKIHTARSKAIQDLLKMAPQSDVLLKLAGEYGLEAGAPADGCIRCRLCINVCREIVGANALEMVKKNGQHFVVPVAGRCIGGATCANICPTHVIKVEDRDNVRTISIRDEIIGRHPLERCEGCGRYFETPGFLKHMEDHMTPHPVLKTHHRYCQACAKLYSDRILSIRPLK